jgi:hypothetical protein
MHTTLSLIQPVYKESSDEEEELLDDGDEDEEEGDSDDEDWGSSRQARKRQTRSSSSGAPHSMRTTPSRSTRAKRQAAVSASRRLKVWKGALPTRVSN